MVHCPSNKQIGYILRSYPRLSQTFILNEILALERLGLDLQIYAVTNPHESIVQPQAAEVRAPVYYLESIRQRSSASILKEHFYWMRKSPHRYASTLWYTIKDRGIDAGYTASSRFECFLQAMYLSRLLEEEARNTGQGIGHLHAHFAHDPTLITLMVHMLTGISYSFTAHARDLYQIPVPALVRRAQQASSVVTCCCANVEYLDQVLPAPLQAKVHLIHHGVDLQGFQTSPTPQPELQAPLILSIGRLVEKKGFFDLLQACKILQERGYRFRCEIYGDGPLRAELDTFIQQHNLAGQVILAGARTQKQLVSIYQAASIFALTPTITEDGDRDGIPNVLVEAMACGLPVVSTTVGGIPELLAHNENGLVYQPHDIQSVAAGLAGLLNDERKRKRLGVAARRTVSEGYDASTAAGQLAAIFENTLRPASILSGVG